MTTNTKIAMIALSATSIEWYDFFLYGTAAAGYIAIRADDDEHIIPHIK